MLGELANSINPSGNIDKQLAKEGEAGSSTPWRALPALVLEMIIRGFVSLYRVDTP